MTRNLSVWNSLRPFSVGFDRTIDTLSLLANSKQTSNYPPYNIRKVNEEQYTIEVAVAGFEESELDIEAAGENLTITGTKGAVQVGGVALNRIEQWKFSDSRNIEKKMISEFSNRYYGNS